MIETIANKSVRYALIIRASHKQAGIEFFTGPESTLQLGYMQRDAGYNIAPHIHTPVERIVEYTYEVLFIKSGVIRADFYDESEILFDSRVLSAGDVILLERGGHGFSVLEGAEIIEVKQGPYAGTADKKRFSQ